jgi:hypothetical protein
MTDEKAKLRHSIKYYSVVFACMSVSAVIPTLAAIHFKVGPINSAILLSGFVLGAGFPLDRAIDNFWRDTLFIHSSSPHKTA